ncbi:TonB-dependent receptor [Novosphingobium resinovorum]|uniref:TonB-dependent receptor n=1 Tax=Novosphingobium resinovorum TaxID=158500 RepID=A0A1D8AEL9_9SPHN|nr:TonB-dependent receptor [Novosphingobium resinovorum]AOR80562.1 hypothetical protein BES08_27345 [Novosphingobium resinovorum]
MTVRVSPRHALAASVATIALAAAPAMAQQAPANEREMQEIIVTAQKREQSIKDVGMSIQATSGEELSRTGITDVAGLSKVTAGFFANESIYQTPVYTIRGIGFQDSALGAGPTVSVYTDQAPIPFSAETQGVTLDLQRVEVLKGPQGTLFGQNSTGGAVNYIANTPTDHLSAGLNASLGRFWTTDVEGFVSGPISDTLRVRLAGRTIQSGSWQYDYVNGDKLGKKDFLNGRFLAEFEPSSAVKFTLNVSGWRDRSEEVIPQFFGVELNGTNVAPPDGYLNYPVAPKNTRAASWDKGRDWRRNNHMVFTSLRGDFDLGGVTVTSLTSYQDFHRFQPIDGDGTSYTNMYVPQTGDIETFYQELRVSGDFGGRGSWMIGGNYEHDKVFDQFYQEFPDSSAAYVFGLPLGTNYDYSRQKIRTFAAFANVEYPLTDRLTLLAGARYTKSKRNYESCGYDAGDGNAAAVFEAISDYLRGLNGLPPAAQIGVGQCFSLTGAPDYLPALERNTLTEDNVSWRAGLNYKLDRATLLYANISKGYKAGSFPTISVSFNRPQLLPVTQESVLAYELGIKSTQAQGRISFDLSGFYYDYRNKQLLGAVLDPIFGPLNALVNVPKSHIIGFDLAATLIPVDGLTIKPMLAFTKTRIDGNFVNYDYSGALGNFTGEPFPFARKWQGNVDVEYRFPVADDREVFLGANVDYAGASNSKLGEPERFKLNARALLDLRAGIEMGDVTFSIWGRNVTDKFYITNSLRQNDADIRFVGAPATYGATVNVRFQ